MVGVVENPPALIVAAAQIAPAFGDIPANVATSVATIREAAAQGVDLVVFPELSLIGYDLDQLTDPDLWIREHVDRLQPVHDITRETGVTAVIGAAYRETDGTGRLASLVIRPDGTRTTILKMHVHTSEDAWFASAPYPPQVVKINGWNIVFAICFDAANPSHAMAAADAGADLYVDSGLYLMSEIRRLDLHFGARAMDHRMYVLFANSAGTGPDGWISCGRSGTWGPDGEVRQTIGTETGLVIDRLTYDEIARYKG